ncbi:DUF7342 family protein [Haloferax gibbonsii]|uniref:DUF7342 family protein n=1 Tax=Haloferax gibbonsii TaxID=35746 RepID=UPI003CCD7EEB
MSSRTRPSEPRTANWVAAEAEVAHETASKYLKRLTEDGKLIADSHRCKEEAHGFSRGRNPTILESNHER